MKKYMLVLAIPLVAFPAYALRVTNLDKVPHNVALTGNGAPQVRSIAPNATEYFTGAAHGFLSLADGAAKPQHDSVVHADGVLSGIIGNERSEQIPADPDSDYTIWPGGKLSVQTNKRAGTKEF